MSPNRPEGGTVILAKTIEITICPECESPHFNVRWSTEIEPRWEICCEGLLEYPANTTLFKEDEVPF